MMAKLKRVPEARRYLADLPAVTIDQRVQVRQAEASLLRDANDNAAAYAVLKQALVEHPDTPDLLYDAAMVAEKLDMIDEAEASLRRVVELKPDDAQALNALGYTLVDRTPRTSEGFALIEKAYKLAPEDPFILDSMGWAFYRLGKLEDAEAYLRRAMTQRPDAEIAAHLGEVLWKKGDPVRAQRSLAVATADLAAERGAARNGAPLFEVSADECVARRRGARRFAVINPSRFAGVALACAALVLSACTTVAAAHGGAGRRDAPISPSRSTAGCRPSAAADGASANFAWNHDDGRDRIDFASPFGQVLCAHRRQQGSRRRRAARWRDRDLSRLEFDDASRCWARRFPWTTSRSGSAARRARAPPPPSNAMRRAVCSSCGSRRGRSSTPILTTRRPRGRRGSC